MKPASAYRAARRNAARAKVGAMLSQARRVSGLTRSAFDKWVNRNREKKLADQEKTDIVAQPD